MNNKQMIEKIKKLKEGTGVSYVHNLIKLLEIEEQGIIIDDLMSLGIRFDYDDHLIFSKTRQCYISSKNRLTNSTTKRILEDGKYYLCFGIGNIGLYAYNGDDIYEGCREAYNKFYQKLTELNAIDYDQYNTNIIWELTEYKTLIPKIIEMEKELNETLSQIRKNNVDKEQKELYEKLKAKFEGEDEHK